jgi:hypothetical protein
MPSRSCWFVDAGEHILAEQVVDFRSLIVRKFNRSDEEAGFPDCNASRATYLFCYG